MHFVWKNDPEKRLGLDVLFQCTLGNLPDEARRALKANANSARMVKNTTPATTAMWYPETCQSKIIRNIIS